MMVPSFILGGIMPGKLLSLAVAVVTSVASASAMAADEEFYVGLGAGLAYVNDAFVKAHPSAEYSPPLDATSKVERGFAVSGTVGYGFANGVRVEGELGYRKNDLEKMTVREPGSLVVLLPPGAPPALLKGERAIDGDVSAVTLMANLYYDIDLDGGWSPISAGASDWPTFRYQRNRRAPARHSRTMRMTCSPTRSAAASVTRSTARATAPSSPAWTTVTLGPRIRPSQDL